MSEHFEASLEGAASVLLRRCFIASQARASNLLIVVMKRLYPSPPFTPIFWFEELMRFCPDTAKHIKTTGCDGPWDIYSVFHVLLSVLPRLLEQSGSKSSDDPERDAARMRFCEALMLDVQYVYNTRNWWAHRPVSIYEACTAVESLRDTLTHLHEDLLLGADEVGAKECSLAVEVTLQQLRSHSTEFDDWQLDDVAIVMLLKGFFELCEAAHAMVLDCRKSQVDKTHVEYCYSCREQLCKCTGLKASHVQRGDNKTEVLNHLTGCKTCAEIVLNCLRDVGPIIGHMKSCIKCMPNKPDKELLIVGDARNRMFHGSKQELVSLVMSTLMSVEVVIGKMKCRKLDGLPRLNDMREELQKLAKFPDVSILVGTAAAAIRPRIAFCPSLPDYSRLTDFDVVKHVLFGSVPLPASCSCFKDIIIWQKSGKPLNGNLGIVKSVLRHPSCVSYDSYTEVLTAVPSSTSLAEVSEKLLSRFNSNAAHKAAADLDTKFCEELENIGGGSASPAKPSRAADIALLLSRAGEHICKAGAPLCAFARCLHSQGHHWLVLQHVVVGGDASDGVASCDCMVKQDSNARLLFVKEKLKPAINSPIGDLKSLVPNAAFHLEELALLYGANSNLNTTTVCVHLIEDSSLDSKYSKFLPIKADTLLVARRDLIESCYSRMWKAITTPGKRQLQLLVGDSGVGKTCTAVAAIYELQRRAMDSRHPVPLLVQLIRGHSAADVDTEFVKFGRALSRLLRLDDGMTEEEIITKLIAHLKLQRYAIFADDVNKDALIRIMERLPVSNGGCVIIATSRQISIEDGKLISGSGDFFLEKVSCFTRSEAIECLKMCDVPLKFFSNPDLPVLMEQVLGHLPLAIRIFATWLRNQDKASDTSAALSRWKKEQDSVLKEGIPEHIRTVVGTVRFALHDLQNKGTEFQKVCCMHMLAIVTLCGSATPLSLFMNWNLLKNETCSLLKHLQDCTGLLQFNETGDASGFDDVDMHTLVRDSLQRELFLNVHYQIDPAYLVGLLEQHFPGSDAIDYGQSFVFLKSIVSSCDAILKNFLKTPRLYNSFVAEQQDAFHRILSLEIQICRVYIRMHSSSHSNSKRVSHSVDSELVYSLQHKIFDYGFQMQKQQQRTPLIIKGLQNKDTSFATVSMEWACLGYHLVEYESGTFRIRGSHLGLKVFPDPSLSFGFADDSIWCLFTKLCEEFHGLSCRYRVVSPQFSTPMDIFLYSSDTLASMKSLIALHANFGGQKIPSDVIFFHNGRQIVGDMNRDNHSLVGLGIRNNSLILMDKLPLLHQNFTILHRLKTSQQLQHAFKLYTQAAALGHIKCSKYSVDFIHSVQPKVTNVNFELLQDSISPDLLSHSSVSVIYDAAVQSLLPRWFERLSTAVPLSVEGLNDTLQKHRILSGQSFVADELMFKFSNQRFLRIYFSADVSEFKRERDFLQQHFVPFLKQSCISRGFHCIFSDMHHGPFLSKIADEHGSDAILKELEKCQRESAGVAYIAFSGKSKGVTFVPDSIPTVEYDALVKKVCEADSEHKEFELDMLKTWFLKDFNSPPSHSCCVLQPGFIDQNEEDIKKKMIILLEKYMWLSNLMSCELRKSFTSEDKSHKSVVILKCAPVQRKNTHPSNVLKSDMQDDMSCGYVRGSRDTDSLDEDTVARSTFCSRHKLESDDICMNVKCIEDSGRLHEYLLALSRACCEPIIDSLMSAFSRTSSFSDLFMECLFHHNFALERMHNFCDGIESIQGVLGRINAFFEQSETRICVLHGSSGSGKTCIMSQSIGNLQRKYPDAAVIFRFIGASPRTGKAITLLYDICLQLNHLTSTAETHTSSDIPIGKDEIRYYFIKLIRSVGQQKRLVFVLDSLDQLKDDDNYERPFWWLPQCRELLNSNVHFLISAVSSSYETHDSFELNKPKELCLYLSEGSENPNISMSLIGISRISEKSDLKVMFRHILNSHSGGRRIISEEQTNFILKFFEDNLDSRYPLFLSIIAQNALSWRSYSNDPDPILPNITDGVRGVIQFELCRLENKFGFEFTSASLSFLSLAVEGISELELSELLFLDDDVLAEILTKYEDTPIAGGLPTILVSMLIDSIKLFLTRRCVRDQELLSWYHRQFVETCKFRYCLMNDDSPNTFFNKRSSQLAQFFTGKWSMVSKPFKSGTKSDSFWLIERVCALNLNHNMDRRTRPQPFCFAHPDGFLSFFRFCGDIEGLNLRRCTEAVHHLIGSARYCDAILELCSFDGISARIQCGEHFSMMANFCRIQELLKHHDVQQSLLIQSAVDKDLPNMPMLIDHFKRWLDSSLEFILQKPRLHTIISCSLQPSESYARQKMLTWFNHDIFTDMSHCSSDYVANMLFCCPRLHWFDGKSLKLRLNRKSLTCLAISERYSAFIILKRTKEQRLHCVEIRDNSNFSIIDTFSLYDAFLEISACWNTSGSRLAIACFHHNQMLSTFFVWNHETKVRKYACPCLECVSWGKALGCVDYQLAVVCCPSTSNALHEIKFFDLSSSDLRNHLQPLNVTFSCEFTLSDDRSDSIQRIIQLELLSFRADPQNFLIHVAMLGTSKIRNDREVLLECKWQDDRRKSVVQEILVDSRIQPRKVGEILRISNHIPQEIVVVCSHGIAIYSIQSSKTSAFEIQILNNQLFREAVDSAHFMTVDQHKLVVLTISHFPNDPARLDIWFKSGPRDLQLAHSVRLHANFFGNCFSCGSHWYATLDEELDSAYVTFWKLDEVLICHSRAASLADKLSSNDMELGSCPPIFWEKGNIRLLRWKDDSSVVASIGVACSPSSFDVVDFWELYSNSQNLKKNPSIRHLSCIRFRCLESVKSVHWIPPCLANDPSICEMFAVLIFNERLQLVTYDISQMSEPKRHSSAVVWDQDIKSSCLSSCCEYLALVGYHSVRLLRYKQKCKFSEQILSICDCPFPRKAILQLDRCTDGQTPSFIILMQDVNSRCLEIKRILRDSENANIWNQLDLYSYHDEDGRLPSYFSFFQLKCSPDGCLCAISCSSERHSKVVVWVLNNASEKIMEEEISHCISDLSWCVSSCDLKYILASGDSNVSTDESSPCSFIFSKKSASDVSFVYEYKLSRLWDPEQMSPQISTGKISFSPNGKFLASASTNEIMNFFVFLDFLEQTEAQRAESATGAKLQARAIAHLPLSRKKSGSAGAAHAVDGSSGGRMQEVARGLGGDKQETEAEEREKMMKKRKELLDKLKSAGVADDKIEQVMAMPVESRDLEGQKLYDQHMNLKDAKKNEEIKLQTAKLKQLEKRLEHTERARAEEERPLMIAKFEKHCVEMCDHYESEALKQRDKDHADWLINRDNKLRFARLQGHAQKFLETLRSRNTKAYVAEAAAFAAAPAWGTGRSSGSAESTAPKYTPPQPASSAGPAPSSTWGSSAPARSGEGAGAGGGQWGRGASDAPRQPPPARSWGSKPGDAPGSSGGGGPPPRTGGWGK